MNLMEATMLALQGKLNLQESVDIIEDAKGILELTDREQTLAEKDVVSYKGFFIQVDELNDDTDEENIITIYNSEEDLDEGNYAENVSLKNDTLAANIMDYIDSEYCEDEECSEDIEEVEETETEVITESVNVAVDETVNVNIDETTNVSVDENTTVVDTEDATVIVTEKTVEPVEEIIEEPIEELPVEELPVEEVEVTEVPEEEVIEEPVEEIAEVEEVIPEEAEVEELVEESKEVKTEDIGFEFEDELEEALKATYEEYCNMGMEDSFWDDMVRCTSITSEEIEKLYKSTFEESKEVVAEEGKELKTESYADARPNETKLLDYLESTGCDWENLAKSLLGWLSDDEVGRFATSEGYDIEDEEEEEDEELDESKEIETVEEVVEEKLTEAFNAESFEKALTEYYQKQNNFIESVKVEKLLKNNQNLKIEAVLTNKDEVTKSICLEMPMLRAGKQYTKYTFCEGRSKKTENNQGLTTSTLLTFTNNDNVVECKYVK